MKQPEALLHRELDRGFGHSPRIAGLFPVGSAAWTAPASVLPSALAGAAIKLAETGAEKRRAKFLLISYEWGESVCSTHC